MSPYPKILIVEDDSVTRRLVERVLQIERYLVTPTARCEEARAMLARERYDLILLDIVLPDGDGLTFCREVRARTRAPIVMLTARGDAADVVAALELGADDYITKPFDVRILVARVRSHIRRSESMALPEEREVAIGDLTIDPSIRDARRGGVSMGLTAKEFELLYFLACREGRAVSRKVIEEQLFSGEVRSAKIIGVYVRKVREKIEPQPSQPRYLHTVRGFGYRLTASPRPDEEVI